MEDYKDPKDQIMKVYYHIEIAAFPTGLSLDRWQNSITTMIEKIPGCPRINKLRVIHLFQADYNLPLKIIWARRLVWNAHDAGQLKDGQAGAARQKCNQCGGAEGNEIPLQSPNKDRDGNNGQ
jgi:hypothetical protein